MNYVLKRQITVYKSRMRDSFHFYEDLFVSQAASCLERVSLDRFATRFDSDKPAELHRLE